MHPPGEILRPRSRSRLRLQFAKTPCCLCVEWRGVKFLTLRHLCKNPFWFHALDPPSRIHPCPMSPSTQVDKKRTRESTPWPLSPPPPRHDRNLWEREADLPFVSTSANRTRPPLTRLHLISPNRIHPTHAHGLPYPPVYKTHHFVPKLSGKSWGASQEMHYDFHVI